MDLTFKKAFISSLFQVKLIHMHVEIVSLHFIMHGGFQAPSASWILHKDARDYSDLKLQSCQVLLEVPGFFSSLLSLS